MSTKSALLFIQHVGRDESIKDKIRAHGLESNLETLVSIGLEAGYSFTAKELMVAYRLDWNARWIFNSSRSSR
ncbi:MAG: Nif11-like leader peptide family natural product precursor [Methanothrix sp.]